MIFFKLRTDAAIFNTWHFFIFFFFLHQIEHLGYISEWHMVNLIKLLQKKIKFKSEADVFIERCRILFPLQIRIHSFAKCYASESFKYIKWEFILVHFFFLFFCHIKLRKRVHWILAGVQCPLVTSRSCVCQIFYYYSKLFVDLLFILLLFLYVFVCANWCSLIRIVISHWNTSIELLHATTTTTLTKKCKRILRTLNSQTHWCDVCIHFRSFLFTPHSV